MGTALAQVTIESKPAHSPALYEWPQPYENGDDGLSWFAHVDGQPDAEIQRDRLTDNVMWCSVVHPLTGVTGFSVTTGATTGPATAWSEPDLTGLGMRWTWAHESSIHFADFTDTTTQVIERDGHNVRVVRRYVMSEVTSAGTGSLVVGEGVLCHHVWLTFRADLPNVVKCEVLMSNAAGVVQTDAASLAARGGGIVSSGVTQLASIGFSDCDLIAPTVGTWAVIQDHRVGVSAHSVVVDASTIPGVNGTFTSNAHCFPRKMGTIRRFVLYKTSAGATLAQAQDVLDLDGLGRATADGPRSYHTVRAFGPSMSLLPRLDLGGFTGGYQGAKDQCDLRRGLLTTALTDGTNTYNSGGGEFGEGTGSARLGLFQFVGTSDPQAPGGQDIGTFCGGLRHIPAFVRFASLYSSLKVNGCGLFLFERTTGIPLRTSDFALAYAGGAVANYTGGAQFAGIRQPFAFYGQNNGGYETRGGQQEDMAGWTLRDDSWPPHFFATQSWENAGYYWMKGKWWPKKTGDWGTAPRSNWAFNCDYQSLLEYVPWSEDPTAATQSFSSQAIYGFLANFPPQDGDGSGAGATRAHLMGTPTVAPTSNGPLGSGVCWKDPEDNQHAIRVYRHLIPMVWLGGDLLSAFVMDMVAEYYALEYSEMGFLANPNNTTATNRSLLRRLDIQDDAPQTARFGTGRGDAWVALAFATQYALATEARRSDGYPVYGIKTRAKMMFDFIRLGVIEANGMTMRIHGPDVLTLTAGTGITPGVKWLTGSDNLNGSVPTFLRLGADINGAAGAITDGSIAGFVTRRTTVIKTFTGCNWDNANRRITSPTATFNSYGFAEGDITGTTHPYTPLGEVTPNMAVMQAGLELPKVAFGYFALMKQIEALLTGAFASQLTQAQGHFETMWSEYVGRTSHYFDYWPLNDGVPNGQKGPPNFIATWNDTANVGQPGSNALGGPFGSGGHWPEALQSLELAYRVSGDIAVLQTANFLGNPVAGPAPDGRAIQLLNAESGFYGPGLMALMQRYTVEGADAAFAPPSIAPQIQAFATLNPVTQGDTTVIRASVTPGANPTSLTYTVTAFFDTLGNPGLSVIGPLTLLDDGVSPDLTAGDLRFNANLSTLRFVPGTYSVRVQVEDDQERTDSSTFLLVVGAVATGPVVFGSLSPFPVEAGQTLTLFADVTVGSDPIASVVADCSELGGLDGLEMLDDGVAPDVTASDDRYTGSFVVPASWPAGNYTIRITATDDQDVNGTVSIAARVTEPVVAGELQVVARFNPNPIHPGDTLTVEAAVSPATGLTSADVRVFADYSALGGKGAEEILDDGVSPDAVASDSRFTGTHVVGAIASGEYQVGVNAVDVLGGSATYYVPITVIAVVDPTDPVIFPTLSPNPVVQGETFTLTVLVVPGSAPASSGIAVVADLVAFGLGAAEALTDQGGGIWDIAVPVGLDVIPGDHRFVVTMTDAELREATAQVTETVLPFVPVPTNPLVFLPVFEAVGAVVTGGTTDTMYPVALDAGERLVVYDEDGLPFVIESSPDASATNGGQLPVTDEDGVTVHLVPFTVLVQPPDPPDPPEPPVTVIVGAQTGGERVGRGMVPQLEAVGAG